MYRDEWRLLYVYWYKVHLLWGDQLRPSRPPALYLITGAEILTAALTSLNVSQWQINYIGARLVGQGSAHLVRAARKSPPAKASFMVLFQCPVISVNNWWLCALVECACPLCGKGVGHGLPGDHDNIRQSHNELVSEQTRYIQIDGLTQSCNLLVLSGRLCASLAAFFHVTNQLRHNNWETRLN